MIRFALFIYILVTFVSPRSLAKPVAKSTPLKAAVAAPNQIPIAGQIPLAGYPPGTLLGAPGTVVAPGVCPPGYLPQYCGMQAYGGACTPTTPIYQCIGQARAMGTFAASGCQLGDYYCMAYQQQMTAMGCPPGPMQGACVNYQRQQQYQRNFRNGALIGLGIGLGATLLPKMLSSMGDSGSSPRARADRGTVDTDSGGGYDMSSRRRTRSVDVNPASVVMAGNGLDTSCGAPPPTVQRCLQEAIDFRNGKDGQPGCRAAQRGPDQKIVINDYCGNSNSPSGMWIFDQKKQCLGKTAVSFGNGINDEPPPRTCTDGSGNALPCSEDRCHTTPPGFHVTCVHNGATYNESNSMGLCALEDQGSFARHILIHYAKSAGGATSWGCSGVPGYKCFQQIQQMVNYGALVYNCFCEKKLAPTCDTKAGMASQRNPANCSLEPNSNIPDGGVVGDAETRQ